MPVPSTDKILKAFTVSGIVVYAHNGSDAKVLAAPRIKSDEEWREDVSGWVALRAERQLALDAQIPDRTAEPHIPQ